MFNFSFSKIKINFSGTLESLVKKLFFVFLFFLIVISLLSGIVFYKYVYLAKNGQQEADKKDLKINTDGYQKMVDSWAERLKVFEEADTKEFKNPF